MKPLTRQHNRFIKIYSRISIALMPLLLSLSLLTCVDFLAQVKCEKFVCYGAFFYYYLITTAKCLEDNVLPTQLTLNCTERWYGANFYKLKPMRSVTLMSLCVGLWFCGFVCAF